MEFQEDVTGVVFLVVKVVLEGVVFNPAEDYISKKQA
jgi:hypothetical protein